MSEQGRPAAQADDNQNQPVAETQVEPLADPAPPVDGEQAPPPSDPPPPAPAGTDGYVGPHVHERVLHNGHVKTVKATRHHHGDGGRSEASFDGFEFHPVDEMEPAPSDD